MWCDRGAGGQSADGGILKVLTVPGEPGASERDANIVAGMTGGRQDSVGVRCVCVVCGESEVCVSVCRVALQVWREVV